MKAAEGNDERNNVLMKEAIVMKIYRKYFHV
jgi:hypothetical protein